ncbi:MAG TPA: hypothetical protein VM912_23350 [Terriglobales bacterium]|nr:hypothetical protein [Terriglobales bacterium]
MRLAFAILLIGSALSAQLIPHTEAEALSGKKVVLPDAFAGHPALFTIGFSRNGGDSAGRWGKDLRKELAGLSDVHFYSVAVLQDAPKLMRGMIRHGMRSGTPKAEQDSFIVLEQDEDAWKKVAGFADPNDAYILLVDSAGNVRWRTHGKSPDQQTLSAVKDEVAKLTQAGIAR